MLGTVCPVPSAIHEQGLLWVDCGRPDAVS
jgi:hypothetical protein